MPTLRKYMRPKWIIACTCVLLVIAVLGGATIYLNSPAFRQRVIGKANAAIAGEIGIGGHNVSLLTGRLILHDVRLIDRQNRPVIGLERLRLKIFWPAMIWREIHIGRLELLGPDLTLREDRDGRLNLTQALAGEAPTDESRQTGKPWQVQLDDFRIINGRVSYHSVVGNRRIDVTPIDLKGDLNLQQRTFQAQLSVGRVALDTGDVQQALEQIILTASHDPRRPKPILLGLSVPGADIQIDGRMDMEPAVPTLDLDFTFDAVLDQLNAWLPKAPLLQGRASGRGKVRGAIDDPGGEIHLEVNDARVDDVPVDVLTVDLKLDKRHVTISDVKSQSAWGRINLAGWIDLRPMFPESWRQSTSGPENLTYGLQVSGRDLLPKLMPQNAFDWGGKWQADIAANGKGVSGNSAAGSATVTLQAEAFKPPAAPASETGKASFQLAWAGPEIEIASLAAEVGSHSLQAHGSIDFESKQIHGDGELGSSSLSDLGALFGITLPSGQGTLQLKWAGDWTRPSLQGNLLAQNLEISGWRIGRLLAEADLNPDGLIRFSKLVLENQGSLLEGEGSLTLRSADNRWLSDPPVTLALSIQQLEPHDFHDLGPWQGRFDGQLQLSGSLTQPIAELEIAAGNVSWQTVSGLLSGTARWQDGGLEIANLNLTTGQSYMHMKGTMRWRDPERDMWRSDAYVTAEILDGNIRIEDLLPGYAGSITAEAVLDGRMSALRGTFHLKGSDLDLKHQQLSAVDLRGHLSDQRLHLDDMVIRILPGQELTGAGWYGFDGKYNVKFAGKAIQLRHIDALQRVYPVTGHMGLQLRGEGSLDQPNFTAAVDVSEPSIQSKPLDDFHVDISLQNRLVQMEAQLNFYLKAYGRLDNGDFSLQARFDQSELTPYLAMIAGEEWAANLTGNIQASGNWRRLDRIDTDTTIASAKLNYRAIPLLSAEMVRLQIRDGAVDLSGDGLAIMSDGYLDLSASGRLSSNLNVKADGRIPLAALAPFTESLADAQGEVTLKAAAGGPLSAMQWQADLTLDKIGFAVPALAQTVEDLNGHLMVSPQSILIESLSGELDGGRFALDGRLDLEQYTPVRGALALQARNLPMQWPGIMDVVINGDLKLSGKPENALLSGRLDLVEGTYYKDLRLNLWSAVSQPRRAESVSTGSASAPWMEDVALAISVGYRNPFLVDNNLASLQIVPDLKISGTLAKPVLDGRAEVTEGEILFRGKSFAVKTGVVDFVNPFKIEPTLDVVSQARIRQWLVSLSVSGTPDRLIFELSSDPPESDNDILSLILFGRTQAEFTGRGTEGSQTTTQMLAALVATAWGDDLKKTTGMDILEVDTGTPDSEEDPERIQVTVGKKMGRRLTIKYAVESTNGEMIQRAISEYRFLEQLMASGYQDSKGDYGGELVFRIEFR